MINNKIKFSALLLICGITVMYSCSKIEKGFLSENLFYVENPFFVTQGVTSVSSSLVVDGSTVPLDVELLKITDKASGQNVDSIFLKPQELQVFTGSVSYTDSTVEGLRSKLKDSMVAPFSVNPQGGRLQFTGTSTFIPQGVYSIDIAVSNVRGKRTLENACDITVIPTAFFVTTGTSYNYLLDTISQGRTYTVPEITATRDENGPATISIKWIDEDGKVFNPANGEVLARPGLASFQNWDPYYKAQLTDTSFVFQYPDHVPEFPVFNPASNGAGGVQGDYWCYYKIPAKFITAPGQEARTGFSFKFPNAVGSYFVTIREVGVHKR